MFRDRSDELRPVHSGTARLTRRSDRGEGLSPAATLVRSHDRDRFQTALFAPAAHREALFALYAFNYEIARVRESVHEAMLGQIRLQWWREAIDSAYGDGPMRRHEVVEAVTAAIRERNLSRGLFDRLIDTREHDLDDEPPATLAALEDYAEGTSATLIYLALEVLVAAAPPALEAARRIGIAYAFAGLMRAMPVHAQAGRSFIPASLAAGNGDIVLPVNLAVGQVTKPELNVQTRSVHDLIDIAASSVEVPPEHAALGIADTAVAVPSPFRDDLRIQSSPSYPSTAVLVAVRHRGYWFYIPADDGPSKLTFRLLQTLIGMRLVEGTPQTIPTLTIPVSR